MIGQTLGHYKIEATLGKGGMATVFLALQENLGRRVALKILNPEYARHKVLIERFRRECQALATLTHPHILTIYDSGEERGLFYYTMECINEPTLFQVMVDLGYPAHTLELEKTIEVVGGVLDALQYCHDRKVLHRDLKPSNIFVADKRGAVLADFGLAQLSELNKLTAQGAFLGTELYASPEQLLGEELDGRSDIYQMGLILYELVAGRLPFPNVWTTILHMKCEQSSLRSPRDINPAIPPELEAVLLKSVAKKREDRYQTAAEFKQALEAHRNTVVKLAPEPARMDPSVINLADTQTVAKRPDAGGTATDRRPMNLPSLPPPSVPLGEAASLPPLPKPAERAPLPLQLKIFIGFAALIVALFATTFFIVSTKLETQVNATEALALDATQRIVQEFLKGHYERLRGQSMVTAESPRLKAAINTDDPNTVKEEAGDYLQMIRADLLVVSNRTGKILASLAAAGQEAPTSTDFHGLPVFQGREPVTGTMAKGQALYLIVSVPMMTDGPNDSKSVDGYLITGFAVNLAFAELVKSIAASDLVFALKDQLLVATLPLPEDKAQRDALLAPVPAGTTSAPTKLAGMSFLRAVLPISKEPEVRAVLLRDLGPANMFLAVIQRILGGLGTLAVLVALVVSFVLTRGLTANLKVLVTAVREMERGNYDAPIAEQASDEIGFLGRSFAKMRNAIKAQVENLKAINQNLKYKVEEIICREVLGSDYDEIKTIGRGAMGIVCKAKNVTLDRVVAVKILSPTHAEDEASVKRFLREAQIMAKVHHPHVLAVYQVRRGQLPFVEMEYFPSEDLDALIKKKSQLPLDLTVHIFRQIVNAVGFLHDNRIIHRDIKPENILVQNEDVVKLVDFGIARDTSTSRMTVDGEFLGTVAFMAPEQMTGSAVDHRADIYALGITLWCMLTGRLPFPDGALVKKRANIKAWPSSLVRGLPREVDALLEKCLADDPAERFQGCYELGRALEPLAAYVEANVA